MATIAVQELPRFGAALGGLVWTPFVGDGAIVTGPGGTDDYQSTGREMILVRGGATWTDETLLVESRPAPDSGRDVNVILAPGAVNGFDAAGPFKPRNFQVTLANPSPPPALLVRVQLTGLGTDVTELELAIIRFTTG